MQHFRAALCLHIIACAFGQQDLPSNKTIPPPSDKTIPLPSHTTIPLPSHTTIPPPSNKQPFDNKKKVFTCEKNLNPSFMVDVFCDINIRSSKDSNFKNASGLIISSRWVLGSAWFLGKMCKYSLDEPGKCFIGSLENGTGCKNITVHKNYTKQLPYDVALLEAVNDIPTWSNIVPWPLESGQVEQKCQTIDLYGPPETMDLYGSPDTKLEEFGRKCTKMIQLEPYRGESLFWMRTRDLEEEETCEGGFRTGLLVCMNVVVGILTHQESPEAQRCDGTGITKLWFTRINDYYGFIQDTTHVEVPFTLPPVTTEETTTEETTIEENTTGVKTTERWPQAPKGDKEAPHIVNCNNTKEPFYFAKITCNLTLANGFFLSGLWVLASASSLKVNCEPSLGSNKGCLIHGLNNVTCEKIVYHEKFNSKLPYYYDLALVKAEKEVLMKFSLKNIPWPTTKGFSNKCTKLSFYAQRRDRDYVYTKCYDLTILNSSRCSNFTTHRHSKEEPILCSHDKLAILTIHFCQESSVIGSLAVCNNVVVGIMSHDHIDKQYSCELSDGIFVFTRIEDYYTFIRKTTGLQVPFESSPPDNPLMEIEAEERRTNYSTYSIDSSSSAPKFDNPLLLVLLLNALLMLLS